VTHCTRAAEYRQGCCQGCIAGGEK